MVIIMANNEFNFVYTRRYKITQRSLDKIAENIKKNLGIDVYRIQEIDDGYVFIGKYGISIGDLTYLPQQGEYRKFNYHQGAKESILARDKEEKRKINPTNKRHPRRFKLQRKRLGIALAAGSIALLIAGGSITLKTNALQATKAPTYAVQQVNTVASANDLILNAWANYAMGLVVQGSQDTSYEHAQVVADDLRSNYFNNAMLQFFNYTDQIESGLPIDVIGKLKDSYHNEFRNQCYLFDEALESSYYSYATFDESPYADAVVFDQNGDRVVANGLYGESCDGTGNLILPGGNIGYSVYVKAVDVPGNDYSITNLPADTRFINGETYVSDEHLDDFVNVSSKSK